MKSRITSRLVLVVAVAVLAGCVEPTVDYAAFYHLEVANDAAEYALVRVQLGSHTERGIFYDDKFKDLATGASIPYGSGTGILALMSGERTTLEVTVYDLKDSAADSHLVRSFSRIEFLRRAQISLTEATTTRLADVAMFRSAWTHRRYRDLEDERLFVESPDRPFYLERDSEDPELGRIVITFVPSAGGMYPSARTNFVAMSVHP